MDWAAVTVRSGLLTRPGMAFTFHLDHDRGPVHTRPTQDTNSTLGTRKGADARLPCALVRPRRTLSCEAIMPVNVDGLGGSTAVAGRY